MQNSIREDQLQSEIMNIPIMINYYIRSDLSLLIDNLTRRFITPNSLYSEELTEKSKAKARAAVQPRERTYVIHIGIDQAKYDCLVPDQSLIVTLGIADRLFLLTAIGQLISDVAGIPVFVTMLFDELDPEIGDIHG